MLPSDSFKTVRATFTYTQNGVTGKKEALFHIASSIAKKGAIENIVKNSITPENIASGNPITVRQVPTTPNTTQTISNLVIKKLTKTISPTPTYLEKVEELYSHHHYLFFPIARLFIVLIRSLFRSKEGFPSVVKTPEASLALMNMVTKTASSIGGEKLTKLAAHAKETKKWSADLMSGRKKTADLSKKVSNLKDGESFSLILGYWRESGFCPIIFTVTKKDGTLSLDSFCVDEELGERTSSHYSWEGFTQENLTNCLEKAVAFTKKPDPQYFKKDISPGTFIGRAAKNAINAIANFSLENAEIPTEEDIEDPSATLFAAFSALNAPEPIIAPPTKTNRWDSLIKHWHKDLFELTSTDKVLFQANLKLSFISSSVEEIISSKTSSHDKWQKLSELQKEMTHLKAKIKKELQDPLLAATLEQTIINLNKAVETALNSITSELNNPLQTKKIPKMAVSPLSQENKAPSISSEITNLRTLRANITQANFSNTLKDYVNDIEKLGSQGAWSQLSHSISSFFMLLPPQDDQFWDQIGAKNILELSKNLAKMVELQFEAELHLHSSEPPSHVIIQLEKMQGILDHLHYRRIDYVYNEVLVPKVKALGQKLQKVLQECRCVIDKTALSTTKSYHECPSGFSDYERSILHIIYPYTGGVPSYLEKPNDSIFHQPISERGVLAQHIAFCKKLGIDMTDCLDLLAPEPGHKLPVSNYSAYLPVPPDKNPSTLRLGKADRPFRYRGASTNSSLKMASFEEAAALYGKKSSSETPYPTSYEASMSCAMYLQMLAGTGTWTCSEPIPNSILEEVKKDIEEEGYRETLSDQDIQILAEKRHAINLLKKNRISLNWYGRASDTFQKVQFKGTRIRFDPATYSSSEYRNFLFPTTFQFKYKPSASDTARSKYGKTWKGGLKGKISRDFLECAVGNPNNMCSGIRYTPQAMAIIEQNNPSLENLPPSTRLAMRNLCADNSELNPQSSLFLDSFLTEHSKYLELEEVQRRLEYATCRGNTVPNQALCQTLAKEAIASKQYRAAGFLFSLNPTQSNEAKTFYQERLNDKDSSLPKKKYFATLALKTLEAKDPWEIDDWKLAFQSFAFMMSTSEESGNPDLQENLYFVMKEKFIAKFQGLDTVERNAILSSLRTPPEEINWIQDGENWKAENRDIIFDTTIVSIVENGSKGPLPDQIYLHTDYMRLFGSEQHIARVEIKGKTTLYYFNSYQIEFGEKGLIIRTEINGKLCKWARLSCSEKDLDPRLKLLADKGVWLDSDPALQGTIFIGGEHLRANFTKNKTRELILKNITNAEGYRLALPDRHLGLFGFASQETTLHFVNWRNKLHEVLFVDRNQKVLRTKKGFSLIEKERNLELAMALSKQEQATAVMATTAKLPEYGAVCSEGSTLYLQLFFSGKRDCKKALTLYLEKQASSGTRPQLRGSTMGFLFLSEQAASEEQFEKATEFLQKARYSPFLPEEKNDFDSFIKALDAFNPNSLPAKVWKLKCLILVMQIQEEKLQRPTFNTKEPIFSLKKMQEIAILYNSVTETIGTSPRKKNRLMGSLEITEEEITFLNILTDKSLLEFVLPTTSQALESSNTPAAEFTGSFEELTNMIISQPWLCPDFFQKPSDKKSILSLSVYPNPEDLIRGFTSFAKQVASASDTDLPSLTTHLQSLHLKGMSLQNRLIIKGIIVNLLKIKKLSGDKKTSLINSLAKIEPEKKTSKSSILNPGNLLKEGMQEISEKSSGQVNPYEEKAKTLYPFFSDSPTLPPIPEPAITSPASATELGDSFQSSEKDPLDKSEKESLEAPLPAKISELESKINTSSLPEEKKTKWIAILTQINETKKKSREAPVSEFMQFLEEALKMQECLASQHLADAINQDMQTVLPPMKSPPQAALAITLSFPSDITPNWNNCLTQAVNVFQGDKSVSNLLADTSDGLVDLEFQRVKDTKVPDEITYSIKNQNTFNSLCIKTRKSLELFVHQKITELGEKHLANLDHSAFERFERLVDRFVVDNHSDLDPLITEILTALIAIKQIEKKDPEAILEAFNLTRLQGLTPAQARATLVGEYRSGHVSRSFQPNLIKQLANDENIVILSPPGSGKSTTILPVTAQVIAKEKGKFPVILLTDELFHIEKEGFDAVTKNLFQQASCVFSFSRNSPKDVAFLAQTAEKIYRAKKRGGYVITTVSNLAALENELILKMNERDELLKKFENTALSQSEKESLQKEINSLSQKIDWLKKIWSFFHDKETRFIADEIDELYRPNIDYNYALGTSNPVIENIRKACCLVMETLMFPGSDRSLEKLSKAIQNGDQAKLTPQERLEALKALAKTVSEKTFNANYSDSLIDATISIPEAMKTNEEFVHLRKLLSITLPNMPLYPGSQYGPTKNGITIVPKKKGLESEGTRFSDPYELTFNHYLYYAINPPNEEFLKTFWINKENEFRTEKAKEPWTSWKQWWENDVQNLPTDQRYKKLNERLQNPESIKERLDIMNNDISQKIGLFPAQIRSNAHEILHGSKVCGASGTINPDALGNSFTKDASLIARVVMKKTLALIKLDEALTVIANTESFFTNQAKDENICAIIDQAGLQKERSSLEMASILRKACDAKRQILFIHPVHRNKWMWNPDEEHPRAFVGTVQKNCLCYYGEADSRGTDWILPNKQFAMIVGPSCSDDDFIQAYYRARKVGKEQTVNLFVEEGVLKKGATNGDLMKKVIGQGGLERAPLNFKAAMRNLLAIRSHEIRKKLFDPTNQDTSAQFSDFRKYLIQERNNEWQALLDISKQEATTDILHNFVEIERKICEELGLKETKKALTAFSEAAKELKGLPEKVSIKDISSGDTETVQEQVEVTEQAQVMEQESTITSEEQNKLAFSIDRNLSLPTHHETTSESISSLYHDLRNIQKNEIHPFPSESPCVVRSSAAEQLEFFTNNQGFGSNSPFVWFVDWIGWRSPHQWMFALIDSLTYNALKDAYSKDAYQREYKIGYFLKPFSDETSKEKFPFLAENLEGNNAQEELFEKDPSFWEGFIQAKILSGCWAFPTEKEKTALNQYFMKILKKKPSDQSNEVYLYNEIKLGIQYRLGEKTASQSTYPEGFLDSDLGKALLEVATKK